MNDQTDRYSYESKKAVLTAMQEAAPENYNAEFQTEPANAAMLVDDEYIERSMKELSALSETTSRMMTLFNMGTKGLPWWHRIAIECDRFCYWNPEKKGTLRYKLARKVIIKTLVHLNSRIMASMHTAALLAPNKEMISFISSIEHTWGRHMKALVVPPKDGSPSPLMGAVVARIDVQLAKKHIQDAFEDRAKRAIEQAGERALAHPDATDEDIQSALCTCDACVMAAMIDPANYKREGPDGEPVENAYHRLREEALAGTMANLMRNIFGDAFAQAEQADKIGDPIKPNKPDRMN